MRIMKTNLEVLSKESDAAEVTLLAKLGEYTTAKRKAELARIKERETYEEWLNAAEEFSLRRTLYLVERSK